MENVDEVKNIETDKKVTILGTSNRYLMKKVLRPPSIIQKRKDIIKYGLPEQYFVFEKQLEIVEQLFLTKDNLDNKNENKDEDKDEDKYDKIIRGQIDKKLSGYKSQDIIKKIYNESLFIDIKSVLIKLSECKMKCYYCKESIALLYEIVREYRQWTLDRINNDLGHNKENVVISCLECNLKRRRTNQNAFTFTKQLIIKRESYETEE